MRVGIDQVLKDLIGLTKEYDNTTINGERPYATISFTVAIETLPNGDIRKKRFMMNRVAGEANTWHKSFVETETYVQCKDIPSLKYDERRSWKWYDDEVSFNRRMKAIVREVNKIVDNY